MSEIGDALLKRLHSLGVKNELGAMEFPQGTAAQMTFEICMAVAALDARLDALEKPHND
ncbi:hypothetical protein [Mycobacteroides abscessus]|uniref:hypothetical protein n=1 Tax=Mycobacteroides abscessus TaxID=36809 RepID=UPI0012FFE468|nr:hypothetical protein [Mycobacteroides abscessus]